MSSLTRRLLIAEAEKTEADRALETLRLRNEDLRRKYEQLMLDNNHRIHVQEHVYEMSEMKRLTGSIFISSDVRRYSFPLICIVFQMN